MTSRLTLAWGVATAAALLIPAAAIGSSFTSLPFADRREYVVTCAAHYECDVQLQPGERVNDGFNAHNEDWDPHIGYTGEHSLTPHLVLRPSRAGLRTNIILTTTKRTYYLLAESTGSDSPSYYSFAYVDDTYRDAARSALALQAALRAQGGLLTPEPTPSPANVANLSNVCFDFDYSYGVDNSVQPDHAKFAHPNRDPLPPNYVPKEVCSDGKHTYIDFPYQREVPADLPVTFAVGAEGDTLINYTYVASLNRYTIDGVYDSFVLELGSQTSPLRLRIYHGMRGNPPTGRHVATPTPILTPSATSDVALPPVKAPS